MTTSMVALAFFCLFYGLFWNNRGARDLVRLDNARTKRDEDVTRPEHGSNL
jgi:hypothetical protein